MAPVTGPSSTDGEQLVPYQLASRADENRLRQMRVCRSRAVSSLAEAAATVQVEDAHASVGIREPISRDTGVVVVVVVKQSESAGHRCEKCFPAPFVKTGRPPFSRFAARGLTGVCGVARRAGPSSTRNKICPG
jgi:hypothetical protein